MMLQMVESHSIRKDIAFIGAHQNVYVEIVQNINVIMEPMELIALHATLTIKVKYVTFRNN